MINIIDKGGRAEAGVVVTSALWAMPALTKVQEDIASWKVPSLATLRGTVVGAKPLASFFQLPPAPGWNLLRMEDEFDAMLYLGPTTSLTTSHLPASLCADKDYVKMRLARLALTVPAARKGMTDGFLAACAIATAK